MRRGHPDHPPAGRQPLSLLDRVLDSIPPEAGAEVMGTGIVSVALSLDGDETISRILLAIASVTWLALAALVPLRARRDRSGFRADIRTPAAMTAVAGTAVIGARLVMLDWNWAGIATLAIAAITGRCCSDRCWGTGRRRPSARRSC